MWYVPELGGLVGNWVVLLPLLNCKLAHSFFCLHTVLLCMFSAKFGQKHWSKKKGKKFSISGIHLVRRKNFLVCSTNLDGCASCNLVRHMLVLSLQSRILLVECIQWGTRVLQEALCVALETWWLLSKKKKKLFQCKQFLYGHGARHRFRVLKNSITISRVNACLLRTWPLSPLLTYGLCTKNEK